VSLFFCTGFGAVANETMKSLQLKIMEKLLNYSQLSAATGLRVRTLRYLKDAGVIPHIKAGHKLVLFQVSRVEKALLKREVKEIAR